MRVFVIASLFVFGAGCGAAQKPDPGFASRATNYQRQPQPGPSHADASRVPEAGLYGGAIHR